MAAKRSKKKTRKASPRKAAARKSTTRKASGRKKATARKTTARRRGSDDSTEDRVAQIQKLIDVMVEAGAVEVEMEDAGSKLRVRLKEEIPPMAYPAAMAPMAPAGPPATPAAGPAGEGTSGGAGAAPADEPPPGTEVFKSPMVGTFYRASAPDSEPFVKEGDRADPETTLCIIEAMKVMNEIKAERELEVVRILAENGEPVEFGQPLFLVRA